MPASSPDAVPRNARVGAGAVARRLAVVGGAAVVLALAATACSGYTGEETVGTLPVIDPPPITAAAPPSSVTPGSVPTVTSPVTALPPSTTGASTTTTTTARTTTTTADSTTTTTTDDDDEDEDDGPPTATNIRLRTSFGGNNLERVPSGATQMCILWDWTGMPTGTQHYVAWNRNGERYFPTSIPAYTWELDASGTGANWCIGEGNGLKADDDTIPEGNWQWQWYVEGDVVASARFEVG